MQGIEFSVSDVRSRAYTKSLKSGLQHEWWESMEENIMSSELNNKCKMNYKNTLEI